MINQHAHAQYPGSTARSHFTLWCSLRAIFIALNDELVGVRALALAIAGRLASHNPGYVLPALRRHLMQLLSDLDVSLDSRSREGTAQGHPMGTFEHLILPGAHA